MPWQAEDAFHEGCTKLRRGGNDLDAGEIEARTHLFQV